MKPGRLPNDRSWLRKKQSNYIFCTLLPKPQTDNQTTLQAFPRCVCVRVSALTLKHNALCGGLIISGGSTGNRVGGSRVATGQVLAPKAQDLLTERCSLGCKKDSPVCYSVVAAALSREGNNLGAASLHCVLLFPLVRGGCISQQEGDNAQGWLKVSLFVLSRNISWRKQTEELERL